MIRVVDISAGFDRIYSSVMKHRKYAIAFVSIFLIFISYFVSQLVSSGHYNTVILLLGPLIFVIFLYQGIKSIIPVFVLACYLNYFVYLFDLPEFITWYIEICAIALLIRSMYISTIKRGTLLKPYFVLFLLALAVHLTSFTVNNIAVTQLFISLRRYFIYYSFFLAIVVLPAKLKYYETLIVVIAFTAFIQIPVSVIQYFVFTRADFMGGLFGKNSSGTISTLGIGFAFLGYYLWRYYKRRKIFLLSGIGMIIPLVIAESKIGMLLLPIAYVYHAILTERRFSMKRLVFLAAAIPLYIGTMYFFDNLHQRSYMQQSLHDPLYMFKFETREMESVGDRMYEYDVDRRVKFNRVESIPLSFILINEDPQKLLLGYGPGEASKSLYMPGSLLQYGFFPTFLVVGCLEIGMAGIIVWLIVFIYLYAINIKCLVYFLKTNSNSIWKAFCFFSNIQMLVFTVEFLYSRSLLLPYKALFFWIVNGLVVWYYYNHIVSRNDFQKARSG